jgi:hypothetical protein
VPPSSVARRLRDAVEPIAVQGFSAPRANLKELGLRFIEGYVLTRSAGLGEPAAPIVVAAFGVFEPTFLAAAYETARKKATRAAVIDAAVNGVEERLGEILGGAPEVAQLADCLLAATANLSGAGRPLFSGLQGMPVPDGPHARLWRATDLVREHRGDGHLAACVSAGLDPVEMNVLTELWIGYPAGEYSSTRGFTPETIDGALERMRARGWVDGASLTDRGSAARDAIEDATDLSQQALVAALGDQAEWAIESANAIAEQIVAAGAFGSDGLKRAAG